METESEANSSNDQSYTDNDPMEQCLIGMQKALGKRNARDAALRGLHLYSFE